MLSLIFFIIALSVLIIFHELGHFLAAKKFGIWVQEFGLGYPPRLLAKKVGETIYSLNWIPAGGFVRIFGDVTEKIKQIKKKLRKRSLYYQPKKVRLLVSVAGVMMNLFLAIIIFALVYSVLGIPKRIGVVKVVGVSQDSPAYQGGLQDQDMILVVETAEEKVLLRKTDELIKITAKNAGRLINLIIARKDKDDQKLTLVDCPRPVKDQECFLVSLTPRENPPQDEGPLGVIITDTEITKPVWWQRPFLGIWAGFQEAFFWGKLIVKSLGQMLGDWVFQGKVPTNVAGPVGIYQATSAIQKESGFWAVFHFFGILSVNFAIVNFLPFPALDGSRLIFLFWEMIARKKPSPKVELIVNQLGMAILIFLLFLVTIGDIRRLLGR